MKRFLSVLFATCLAPLAALAMEQAQTPTKFPIPWGNSAGSAYIRSIPTPSQIGIQNCAASLTDGFPPLTFVPASASGCPPFGQDFNGILRQITQWSRWSQAGGPVYYDSAFAAAIGGYPKGTIIQSTIVPGNMWLSTADDNANDPDAGGAGWVQAPGQVPTGTPMQSLVTTIPTGYVSANGTTIGNAASNATGRANADTQFLFALIWSACGNTQCPIFTSTGAGSTRGASAAADYAANKALAVWNMNGSGVVGADSQNGSTSTNLVGVPVTSGSRTAPGSVLGENLHALSAAENGTHTHGNTLTTPTHTHLVSNPNNLSGIAEGIAGSFDFAPGLKAIRNIADPDVVNSSSVTGVAINNAASGSGTGHNTVSRSFVAYWNLKL